MGIIKVDAGYREYIILFIMVVFLFSCNNCNNIAGIDTSQILPVAKNKGYDYCKVLKNALNKNHLDIREFSTYEFYDAMGYDHGNNIVKLINFIGEDEYIGAISTLSSEEKELVKSYISVDLQFGYDGNTDVTKIEDIFPLLHLELNK